MYEEIEVCNIKVGEIFKCDNLLCLRIGDDNGYYGPYVYSVVIAKKYIDDKNWRYQASPSPMRFSLNYLVTKVEHEYK